MPGRLGQDCYPGGSRSMAWPRLPDRLYPSVARENLVVRKLDRWAWRMFPVEGTRARGLYGVNSEYANNKRLCTLWSCWPSCANATRRSSASQGHSISEKKGGRLWIPEQPHVATSNAESSPSVESLARGTGRGRL